jgi:hypothetical protein
MSHSTTTGSGTSFTIHMTREATNCTTATNYALEGEIRDKPSVPAIPGDAGSQGPWLELIPYRQTTVPTRLILTKTHCKGFCTGPKCGPDKTILTVRSFMMGCLTGTRAVETRRGLVKKDVTYSPALVRKAIHIFRHPLDNIVARFHLEYNVQELEGNRKYARRYPKNATGFRSWCEKEDENRGLLRSPLLDRHLRRQLAKIPCFNDFFRYLQWHNLAFSLSHDMNLPTLVLHYHEYAEDFEMARDKVLAFLELPRVGDGIPFEEGKVYRDYYSNHQKKAIRNFLKEFASSETWEQLEMYDFEFDD